MSRNSRGLLLSAVVLLAPWMSARVGWAESIDDAWAIALSVDQRLEASRDRVQAANCRCVAAEAQYRPSVTNKTSYAFLTDTPRLAFAGNSFVLLESDFVASATTAKMPLYTGGRIGNAVYAASAEVNARKWVVKRTVLDIKLEVAAAYTEVLRARRGLDVARSNQASLAAHQQVVKTLLARGQVPRNDLLAAQVALADATQAGIQAANRLATARATYNRLLGRPLDHAVEIDQLEVEPVTEVLATLTGLALATRPGLAAISAQADALRHRAQSVRAATKPQLGIEGGLIYLETPSLQPNGIGTVMFGLDWTPFDGGVSRAKSNALLHDASALSRLRADMASAIRLQVQNAWLDEQQTRQRIEVTAKAISQAEENLRAAKLRFENGAAINTEVLDAEALRTRTYDNYYNAVYDAVLAKLRLLRAVGTL